MKQYKIVRIKDGAVLGWVIGKTRIGNEPYLIYKMGSKTGKIRIWAGIERLYRVECIEVAS